MLINHYFNNIEIILIKNVDNYTIIWKLICQANLSIFGWQYEKQRLHLPGGESKMKMQAAVVCFFFADLANTL